MAGSTPASQVHNTPRNHPDSSSALFVGNTIHPENSASARNTGHYSGRRLHRADAGNTARFSARRTCRLRVRGSSNSWNSTSDAPCSPGSAWCTYSSFSSYAGPPPPPAPRTRPTSWPAPHPPDSSTHPGAISLPHFARNFESECRIAHCPLRPPIRKPTRRPSQTANLLVRDGTPGAGGWFQAFMWVWSRRQHKKRRNSAIAGLVERAW